MTGLSSLQAFSIDPSSVQKGERKLEVFWIDRLQVNKHRGLNEDLDFIGFFVTITFVCIYFVTILLNIDLQKGFYVFMSIKVYLQNLFSKRTIIYYLQYLHYTQ